MSSLSCSKIAEVSGTVLHGAGQGGVFGFPTANITFYQTNIAGTYAGEVVFAGQVYQSAIYVDQERKLLEAHLFGFSQDLYGEDITVTLFQKIAETEEFTRVAALKKKIARDVEAVKKYFSA